MSESGRELLALVPKVRRARGFRLYLADGRRLVDLWQYGGAAVLGHTAPGVLLALKDTASRGLFSPFPHASEARLEKALLRLIPGRAEVRLYTDEASADAALQGAAFAQAQLGPLRYRDFPDPALIDFPPLASAALWRPWAPQAELPLPAVLAPIIPLPWPSRPIAYLLDTSVAGLFPPSDILSPVVLTAACRAVDDLTAALPLRTSLGFKRTDAALQGAALNSSVPEWSRRGIYLHPKEPLTSEEYVSFFRRFLEKGFLLPPDPAAPAILPLELSAGEDAALAALLCRSSSEIL